MSRRRKIVMYFSCVMVTLTILMNIASMNIIRIKRTISLTDHKELKHLPPTPAEATCHAKQNLVFLKVHKTGSSTMANIIQRYGMKRRLRFALPNKKPGELRYNYFGGIGGTLNESGILPTKTNGSFNLLYNHVVFDKDSFHRIFNNETVYVTILREPFSQFTSALLYFLNDKLYKIATTNLTQYLSNPDKYEPSNRYLSFTDNRQALDLGVPVHKVRHRRFINNYIKILDSSFHLIMITEFFDESLILLKRLMCWSFTDILYVRKNKAYRKFRFTPTEADMVNYREWAMADNAIYNHFYNKFMDTVTVQLNFEEEVGEFKTILKETQSFCINRTRGGIIHFKPSRWSPRFTVTSLDCLYMRSNELRLHNMLFHRAIGLKHSLYQIVNAKNSMMSK